MNSQVAHSLEWSAKAFVELVWPQLGPELGGGELIPVEAVAATEMQHNLDVMCGIDGWQVCKGESRMRGIASRVQMLGDQEPRWNTFTIRYRLKSGHDTEYHKRVAAIRDRDGGWLYPHLTCQAYIDEASQKRLLSCAAVETEYLYAYAEQWYDHVRDEPRDKRHIWKRANRQGGNEFLCVPWSFLTAEGIEVISYHEQPPASIRVHAEPRRQLELWSVM